MIVGRSIPKKAKDFSSLAALRSTPAASHITTFSFQHNYGTKSQIQWWIGKPQQQTRYYTPMTKEEEEAEKDRVSKLSDFKKEQELRQLNREIIRLTMLRGINTGELYTIRGKYKMLLNEYGIPMMVWYGACWLTSGAIVYTLATVGGMDAMAVLTKSDTYTGLNMAARVDPELGKIGIVIILNEMLEPIRLPFVVLTVKPVMDRFFPPKV